MSTEHRPGHMYCCALHTEALQLPSPQRCTEHMKWSFPGPGDRRLLQEQPHHEMQEPLFLASNKSNAFGSLSWASVNKAVPRSHSGAPQRLQRITSRLTLQMHSIHAAEDAGEAGL